MWGAEPIRRLTREDIGDYRARLTDRDLAASTLNQTRAIVSGIFALAAERHGLEDDVSIAFKGAKTRRATPEKISFYPPERGFTTDDDELGFVNEGGNVNGYNALIRRYRTAQSAAACAGCAYTNMPMSSLCRCRCGGAAQSDFQW